MSQLIGHSVVRVQSTASTNNYARSQVFEHEVEEGTVFLAHEQTAGRGHLTNKWESEPGKNLTFSIFIRPSFLPLDKTYALSKVVCLGLESSLGHWVDAVRIKWPNDIYVGDKKICGILIENGIVNGQINQSVIGVGLNVNQTAFLSDAPNPVSLKMLTGVEYQPDEILTGVLAHIDRFYQMLREGHLHEIDQAFTAKLYRMGEWHRYRDEKHEYTGKIVGVNKIGQLRVLEENGAINEYHFKEVAYL